MKMLKLLKKSVTGIFIAASMLFAGCSMTLDSDTVNNSIRDITGLLNRSAIQKMTYMGGSMLYSPDNESTNQLSPGVKIAVRVGSVLKNDIGGGNYVYSNSKLDCFYGYIAVKNISKEKMTFALFVLPDDENYDNAEETGIFTIDAGEGYDITGDGIADLSYTKPAAGRKGQKNNMWLNFLSDIDDGCTTTMFSVIPMQYSRSVYPGGIVGINPNGQYIINKYDVGTTNRAAISSIAYGDYVFDSEANTISRYVGEGINGRKNARSLDDDELKVEEAISSDTTVEDVLFKGNEFTEEFSINTLLAALPATIITEDYAGRTISDNINYLNGLIQQTDFLDKLLAANSGAAVDEIKQQINEEPVSGQLEQVLINRHSLALLYPEKCPDVNLGSGTLADAMPWLYVDLGDIVTQTEVENASRSNISDSMKKSEEEAINARMEKYLEESKQKHASEKGKYRDEFIDYEIKRDVLISRFSELTSFNVAPFLSNLTGVQAIRDIVENTDATVSFGVGGSISFSNGDPSVKLKLAILLKYEMQDSLKVSIASTSIFTVADPVTKTPDELVDEFKKTYPDMNGASESEVKYFFNNYSEENVKSAYGVDQWYFNWTKNNEKLTQDGIVHPTDDAKSLHYALQPVKVLPVVVTFDAQFDIILKAKLMAEFKDCYVGGIALYGVDCAAGMNWGFRKWFKIFGKRICPKIWTFYVDTYGYAIKTAESAGYAGYKTVDTSGVQIGAGAQFVFCPVLEFRAGVGIGQDAGVVSADVTVGVWANIYVPVGLYLGLNFDLNKKPIFVTEATMDLGIAWGANLQLYLNPILISAKRWTYPLYQKEIYNDRIFDRRYENMKCVKGESTIAAKMEAVPEKQEEKQETDFNKMTREQKMKYLESLIRRLKFNNGGKILLRY